MAVRRGTLIPLLLAALGTHGCTFVGYPSGTVAPYPGPTGAGTPGLYTGTRLPDLTDQTEIPPRDGGRSYEVFGSDYRVLDSAVGYEEEGIASWYGEDFHGRPTASGESYDMNGFSAAHRTLPLHTWVEVQNLETGDWIVVRVNDRGPFSRTHERIIDLSYAAAHALGFTRNGTARVRVRAVEPPESRARTP